MHTLRSLAAVAAFGAALAAQSPLCTIQPFAANNGGSVGGAVFFDLQVTVPNVTLFQIDANYSAAIGTPVGIQVYSLAGTYVGNELNAAAWTLIAQDDGTTTAAGRDAVTSFTLQSPVNLSQGSYGIAYVAVGSAHAYTNGTGANQNFSNAQMAITAGAGQNTPWTATPFANRVANTCLYYTAAGLAAATPYGSGCGAFVPAQSAWYELFDAANPTDLANSNGLSTAYTGNGYVTTAGASAIVAPTGTAMTMGDDSVVQTALPFPMPTGIGVINDVYVCSNGFVSLEPTTAGSFLETVTEFLSTGARIAVYWDDLNPTTGGTIHAEADPTNPAIFHITWTNVPEYSATGANTFQLSLHASGNFELKYGAMSSLDGLVGLSLGHGANDPGSIDISPLAAPIQIASPRPDLALAAGARPVINQTASAQTQNIPSNASLGAVLVGFVRTPAPGIALGSIGMPGCFAHTSGDVTLGFTPTGSTYDLNLPVPNDSSLAGAHVYLQSTVIAQGVNALGVSASNGLDWLIDIN